ncbi:GroES-like protein [Meredithblackwellia eburnea MCA 4105]
MASHPSTYRVAQIQEHGGPFKVVDVDWKEPSDGQVVVKILACGVCHSDAIVVHQAWPTGLPRVCGHEAVGDVFAVPSSEKKWKIGDRVGSPWHGGHCGTCDQCRRGDFLMCENAAVNGIFLDGGYGEYCTFRTEALVSVPKDLDPAEVAPLLCAGVTVANSLRNMNVRPGELVAVQGIGGLGHLGIQYARAMGFRTVAISQGSAKEALARELGAHEFIDGSQVNQAEALQKLGGAKVILCTAPNGKAMEQLIEGLAVNGQLVILGIGENLSISPVSLISKRRSIVGWPAGSATDAEDAIALAKQAGVKAHVERFPLDKVNEAFEAMMSNKVRFRSVITF